MVVQAPDRNPPAETPALPLHRRSSDYAHCTPLFTEQSRLSEEDSRRSELRLVPRDPDTLTPWLAGLALLEPGIVPVNRWHPDLPEPSSETPTPHHVAATGSTSTRLIVVRGNSGAGKTSVAAAVRAQLGRTCAVVAQDVIRRTILRERDIRGGANVGLISAVARYALDHGFHVIVEGILHVDHYGTMLADLVADHRGRTGIYYLDVSFEESLRRHATRPQAAEFGPDDMRQWYRKRDLLNLPGEHLVTPGSSLNDTLQRILADAFGQVDGSITAANDSASVTSSTPE